MTRDELIALAKEAGCVVSNDALELADKRIAELEKYGRVQDPLADRIGLITQDRQKNAAEKHSPN